MADTNELPNVKLYRGTIAAVEAVEPKEDGALYFGSDPDTNNAVLYISVKDSLSTLKKCLLFKTAFEGKVDKAANSRLMTDAEGTKLSGIAEGAQANVIEVIKLNGTPLEIAEKAVNVLVPTGGLASKDKITNAEVAESANIVATKIAKVISTGATDTLATDISNINGRLTTAQSGVDAINGKIPEEATAENKLADQAWVNLAIASNAADYLTADESGNNFATHAALIAATEFYVGGTKVTPKKNDYAMVSKDEEHNNKQSRYIVSKVEGGVPTFSYQYSIELNLTSEQIAALNSGITSNHVTKLNGIAEGATKTETSTTNGNIKINGAEQTVYTLPTADATTKGGIIMDAATEDDTQAVHINGDGKPVTKPGEVLNNTDKSLTIDHSTHDISAKISSKEGNALSVDTTSGKEGLYVEKLTWNIL